MKIKWNPSRVSKLHLASVQVVLIVQVVTNIQKRTQNGPHAPMGRVGEFVANVNGIGDELINGIRKIDIIQLIGRLLQILSWKSSRLTVVLSVHVVE